MSELSYLACRPTCGSKANHDVPRFLRCRSGHVLFVVVQLGRNLDQMLPITLVVVDVRGVARNLFQR